ncbi:MAG: PAS domain-containing protein [Elsteraceae bacterium]
MTTFWFGCAGKDWRHRAMGDILHPRGKRAGQVMPSKDDEKTKWVDPTIEDIDVLADLMCASDEGVVPVSFTLNLDCEATWRWEPPEGSLPDSRLNFLLSKWRALRGEAAMPQMSAVDPFELAPALGFVMLLDLLPGGYDCRYRLYGTVIADHAGRDWTGYTVAEMNRITRSQVALFYRGGYRAMHRRQSPMFTSHRSPSWLAASTWSRLILPLAGEDGSLARFLVGNIPGDVRYLSEEQEAEQKRRLRPNQTA